MLEDLTLEREKKVYCDANLVIYLFLINNRHISLPTTNDREA